MGGGRRFFLSMNKTDPELNRTSSYQRWDLDLVDVIKLSPNLKENENLLNHLCTSWWIILALLAISILIIRTFNVFHAVRRLQLFYDVLCSFWLKEWLRRKQEENVSHSYVWNNEGFNAINPQTTDYVLGNVIKIFYFL